MDPVCVAQPVSPKKNRVPQTKPPPPFGPNVSPPSASTPGTGATEEADAFLGGVWIFFSRKLFLETDDSPPVI